ncbi:MAG TPA: glycosyltransferase family 2 protein [Solirubrobacteraceae bacterium]|jgi:teichuronic acid biosynthesis glycosyltransferase TuaG|nr:glycosyltransferase family 2 protein [Solirubrobacteraceae bacterium]
MGTADPPDPASISAIVPTYNDAERIGDALESIAAQTMPPREVVVCDDCSDDHTEAVVRELAARHAATLAIRYLRLPARAGAAGARNAGIAAAEGEWIANCDSDDMWAPHKLERQIEFLRDWRGERRIALVGAHGHNMNDAKRVISPAIMGPTNEREYEELVKAGKIFYVIHSSALFTREDFLAIGGYTGEYGAADDYPFFCRMAERGVVLNIPEPLVYYRKRAGSVQFSRFWELRQDVTRLTVNQRRRAHGQSELGREEFAAQLAAAPARERLKRRRQLWGFYYYKLGSTHMVNGSRLRGALELALAGALDPARVRAGVGNAVRSQISRRTGSKERTSASTS